MPEEKNEKLAKEEVVKEKSNYLRGTIKEELAKNSSSFNEIDTKLLKFHGIYQQDNRDTRQERTAKKLGFVLVKQSSFTFLLSGLHFDGKGLECNFKFFL